ncbi:TetR/AcrR family transcriptional regulator [Streptomyces sp. LP11]|uniref:TetR/AcrR family transcriptional regulator n=1 Tax=Streptomyces pyxinicus TaxID=2970331 RepID=A0ABT2B160_9ACTN|nr:TetR/AcrR family transcriptional regulator [Streptomyces sp. LP11]MCS0602245.1 TetR/AcrR family transcriptional regulator [Streptomyces sp. LP11]
MGSTSTAGRGRPARIDQAGIVETSLALLDDVGLEALTMRRVADGLDVRAGALYRHFATKQDLLTAMAERMLAPIAKPPADAPWTEQIKALARMMRQALLAHRDGAKVFGGTHSTGPHTLAFAESVLGVLRTAGFRDEDAARVFLTVVNFVLGHTLEEQAAAADDAVETEGLRRLRDAVLTGGHPHLAATMRVLTDPDFEAHFEFGLRLLVEGCAARERSSGGGDRRVGE